MNTTTKVDRCPSNTPWGTAQHKTKLGPGIWFASTASHGGIHLSSDRMKQMPNALKPSNRMNAGTPWFEEDCEYCLVVAAFPQYFPDMDKDLMKTNIREYHWQAYEQHFGKELSPGDSYSKDRDVFDKKNLPTKS